MLKLLYKYREENSMSLYNIMNWADVEEIVYSESLNPHRILGAHKIEEGILIQAFIPEAKSIKVIAKNIDKEMEMMDEAGFFSCLFKRKKIFKYQLEICYADGSIGSIGRIYDPYSFGSIYTEDELERFKRGINYNVYEKMGAKKVVLDGIEGVAFSVWAPEAIRVSVVGDFNLWDGRVHQMRRIQDYGIFEIFIPELSEGEKYKFEIKTKKGEPMLKADPYAKYAELRPNTASIIYDIDGYKWKDDEWLKKRIISQDTGISGNGKPMNIYEVHLGSFMRREKTEEDAGFYNYREIAPGLAKYVKDMGYTHIELMPIMEHPLDASWGYQVTGYYAPTSRYGTPEDFMYFIDYLHSKNIGVILDWVPAHFPMDLHGLGAFDGTHVYEHADARQGLHPHWGTYIYNYGRPQVSNFLIANAFFWVEKYHVDGIRMDAVASMLYLDYGKNDGEWVANAYGGKENLEAVEFLRHLNSIIKQKHPDIVLIAEESTAWPKVSTDVREEGLGFDYKWNMGWMNDFLSYMRNDPYFRSHHYGELTFSMLYQYSENFILVLSHDEVVHGKGSLANKMPGATQEEKFANLRAAYGYMMTHPGKKLLFMGQEFGQMDEWNEDISIAWNLLKYDIHKSLHAYVKDLNKFYLKHSALWEKDCKEEGFRWLNCHSYEENIVAFVRSSNEEELLVVSNFTPLVYESFKIGVEGVKKYKEIFNSDIEKYGGSGVKNSRAKKSKAGKVDGKDYYIEINIPPMSTVIFSIKD